MQIQLKQKVWLSLFYRGSPSQQMVELCEQRQVVPTPDQSVRFYSEVCISVGLQEDMLCILLWEPHGQSTLSVEMSCKIDRHTAAAFLPASSVDQQRGDENEASSPLCTRWQQNWSWKLVKMSFQTFSWENFRDRPTKCACVHTNCVCET